MAFPRLIRSPMMLISFIFSFILSLNFFLVSSSSRSLSSEGWTESSASSMLAAARNEAVASGLPSLRESASRAHPTTQQDSSSSSQIGTDEMQHILPPKDPAYNFTVGLCAVAKDVEAYLEEWLDYNLFVSRFDKIYLYDTSEEFDLKQWARRTRQHPVYSNVFVHHYPKSKYAINTQRQAVDDCIQQYGQGKPSGNNSNGPQTHEYMAHFDLDELLVPQHPTDPDQYRDVHQLLQDYLAPYGGGLTINWMLMGTANRSMYAPQPVTKRFHYRDAKPQSIVKSMVKSSDFNRLNNPHAFLVKQGKQIHTTQSPGFVKLDKRPAMDENRPSGVVLLYHYRYTSQKEYLAKKCDRGNLGHSWCLPNQRKILPSAPNHIQPRPGDVLDGRAWELLKRFAPRYRVYDANSGELWPDFF